MKEHYTCFKLLVIKFTCVKYMEELSNPYKNGNVEVQGEGVFFLLVSISPMYLCVIDKKENRFSHTAFNMSSFVV